MMQEQTIGGLPIQQDDPAFARGYAQGQAQFTRWHGQDTRIEAATLLFLVRNGWAGSPHTEMWQTGYIVGWLSALFERGLWLASLFEHLIEEQTLHAPEIEKP